MFFVVILALILVSAVNICERVRDSEANEIIIMKDIVEQNRLGDERGY